MRSSSKQTKRSVLNADNRNIKLSKEKSGINPKSQTCIGNLRIDARSSKVAGLLMHLTQKIVLVSWRDYSEKWPLGSPLRARACRVWITPGDRLLGEVEAGPETRHKIAKVIFLQKRKRSKKPWKVDAVYITLQNFALGAVESAGVGAECGVWGKLFALWTKTENLSTSFTEIEQSLRHGYRKA